MRDGKPTPQCFPFLRWAVDCHQPHWLTTRDAHGQHDGVLRAFRLALGTVMLRTEVETLLRAVKPTKWRGSKVSGIDLASDFIWIDDDPLAVEVAALRAGGLLHPSVDRGQQRNSFHPWNNVRHILTRLHGV